jgi:PPK2 family polyphosphate:nucleotide phosphotransferase
MAKDASKSGAQQPLIPPFGKRVRLKDYDPGYSGGFEGRGEVADQVKADLARLSALQEVLYAESTRAVLIIVQGIDTGGKDGTIRHVFRGLNPQGVQVTSFKQPSREELSHDFLWRIHRRTPPKGIIGVFNRSHYEDVLIVRVHNLVAKRIWKERYDHINRFEEILHEHDTLILKFFLYISKDEQKRRLESRRDDPSKQWKFSPADLKEREHWDSYMEAYEEMLTRCNTEYAPWHIVPGNRKWYRNYVVSRAVVEALEKLNPQYPPAPDGIADIVVPD